MSLKIAQRLRALAASEEPTLEDLAVGGRVKIELKPTAIGFSSSEVSSDYDDLDDSEYSEPISEDNEDELRMLAAAERTARASGTSRFVDVGGMDGVLGTDDEG